MKNVRRIHIISVFFVLLASACKHDAAEFMPEESPPPVAIWRMPPSNNCDSGVVYFENQILKILVTKCAMTVGGCHGMAPFQKDVDLRSYAGIIKHVEPGNLGGSEIYEKITETKVKDRMPPQAKWQLTSEEITLIQDWILQGAPNNKCEPCDDTLYLSFDETIAPLMFKNCSGCHNKIYQGTSGNISFFDYPPTLINIEKSAVQAMNQSILATLKYSDTNATGSAMPRNIGKLYKCEVDKFEKWTATL